MGRSGSSPEDASVTGRAADADWTNGVANDPMRREVADVCSQERRVCCWIVVEERSSPSKVVACSADANLCVYILCWLIPDEENASATSTAERSATIRELDSFMVQVGGADEGGEPNGDYIYLCASLPCCMRQPLLLFALLLLFADEKRLIPP